MKTGTALRDENTTRRVLFRDLLVVRKILGSKISLQRLRNSFGSGDMPFSVRRGSDRSIVLETVYLPQKDILLKYRGGNRTCIGV